MNDSLLVIVLAQAVLYGTPLLYASLGELLAERSGVLNLGVEGMMVFGAAVGYWATQRVHGSDEVVLAVAVGAAALSGAAMALIHAFLTITLRASQIVSGLALTIFAGGLGLSAYFGAELHLAELPATHQFRPLDVFGLGDMRLLRADPVRPVLARLPLVARDPPGGSLPRANAPRAQRARGGRGSCVGRRHGDRRRAVPVRARARRGRVRGRRGRLLQPCHRPGWVSGDVLVNGAGWIAIALVIFAFWRPELCLVGAYLFGGLSALPFALQAHDVTITPEFLQALPYVMTIIVLVLVSTAFARRRLGAPAALGRPYVREER